MRFKIILLFIGFLTLFQCTKKESPDLPYPFPEKYDYHLMGIHDFIEHHPEYQKQPITIGYIGTEIPFTAWKITQRAEQKLPNAFTLFSLDSTDYIPLRRITIASGGKTTHPWTKSPIAAPFASPGWMTRIYEDKLPHQPSALDIDGNGQFKDSLWLFVSQKDPSRIYLRPISSVSGKEHQRQEIVLSSQFQYLFPSRSGNKLPCLVIPDTTRPGVAFLFPEENTLALSLVEYEGFPQHRFPGIAQNVKLSIVRLNQESSGFVSSLEKAIHTLGKQHVRLCVLDMDARQLSDTTTRLPETLDRLGRIFRMLFIIPNPPRTPEIAGLSLLPYSQFVLSVSPAISENFSTAAATPRYSDYLSHLTPVSSTPRGPGMRSSVAPHFLVPAHSSIGDSLHFQEQFRPELFASMRVAALLANLLRQSSVRQHHLNAYSALTALQSTAQRVNQLPWFEQGWGIPHLWKASQQLQQIEQKQPFYEFRNLMRPEQRGIFEVILDENPSLELWGQFWPQGAGSPDSIQLTASHKNVIVEPSTVLANRVSRLTISMKELMLPENSFFAATILAQNLRKSLTVLTIPVLIIRPVKILESYTWEASVSGPAVQRCFFQLATNDTFIVQIAGISDTVTFHLTGYLPNNLPAPVPFLKNETTSEGEQKIWITSEQYRWLELAVYPTRWLASERTVSVTIERVEKAEPLTLK